MSALVERFQRLQRYERASGRAVLESLDSIPDHHRGDPNARRATNIAAHIQSARLEWLWRLTNRGDRPEAIFFDTASLDDVERLTAAADLGWDAYTEDLTDTELRRVAEYSNTAGQPQRCRVADILTHVYNHATYHRGQVALLVASSGGGAAVTDFIFFAYRDPDAV